MLEGQRAKRTRPEDNSVRGQECQKARGARMPEEQGQKAKARSDACQKSNKPEAAEPNAPRRQACQKAKRMSNQ